jgi:cold shock CspA family protein
MQATVSRFVPATESGTVLLDNGTELPFDAAAFRAGGMRLLRVGQRVGLAIRDDRISALAIATFPLP